MRYGFITHMFLCLTLLSLGACQTIRSDDDRLFHGSVNETYQSAQYERAGLLSTLTFIKDDCKSDCPYVLNNETYNDGFSNHYKVTYGDHVFVTQGTAATKELINEVNAISALRKTHAMNVVKDSVMDRTAQLVTTPYHVGSSVYKRYEQAETFKEAALIAPKGALVMTGKLIEGTKELGVTGARITNNASHAKCGFFECLKKLGEDMWYAANLFTGKHGDAFQLHQKYKTNPETLNPLLKREVDRLSYVSSITSTGYKFGLGTVGVPVFANYSTGLGYYNNADFLSGYEDARKQETAHKRKLRSLDIDGRIISRLYSNKYFIRRNRNQILEYLFAFEGALPLGATIEQLSNVETRYDARRWEALYGQAHALNQRSEIIQLTHEADGLLAKTTHGQTLYIIAGDYIRWTEDLSINLQKLRAENAMLQVYFLGPTSDAARQNTQKLGININVI